MRPLQAAVLLPDGESIPTEARHAPRPLRDPFDRALDNLVSESHRSRRILTSPSEPIGTTRPCPDCGETLELKLLANPGGRQLRYWSDCSCWKQRIERSAALSAASAAEHALMRGAPSSRIGAYARFTLSTFNPAFLTNGFKLVDQVRDWQDRALTAATADPTYRTPATCALWFYSNGKGRGKTHLAAALALRAREASRLVAIVDEIRFLEDYWGEEFEKRPALTRLPSEQAWLTVFDDLGARENRPPGLRDVWYTLISPRWTRCGWTIFTSNYTPIELFDRGTIDDRVYSRIIQMTQGRIVSFDGTDQRLVV